MNGAKTKRLNLLSRLVCVVDRVCSNWTIRVTLLHCCGLAVSTLGYLTGPRPLLGKKTLIYLPVTSNREFTKDSSRWDARTHRIDGNIVTVQVHIPANVAVGVWRLRVSTKQNGSRLIKSFDSRERIYVLFNAWCKGKFYKLLTLLLAVACTAIAIPPQIVVSTAPLLHLENFHCVNENISAQLRENLFLSLSLLQFIPTPPLLSSPLLFIHFTVSSFLLYLLYCNFIATRSLHVSFQHPRYHAAIFIVILFFVLLPSFLSLLFFRSLSFALYPRPSRFSAPPCITHHLSYWPFACLIFTTSPLLLIY